jgi:hypothetical protein
MATTPTQDWDEIPSSAAADVPYRVNVLARQIDATMAEVDARGATSTAKNAAQDLRLGDLESWNTDLQAMAEEQDGRLVVVEAKNITQDGRLSVVEAKNTAQDATLSGHEARVGGLETLAGLAPGDVSDATVRNLVANQASTTFDELDKAFVRADQAPVNVVDFPWRADPSGVTDSTAAVQAFFTYLGAAGRSGTAAGTFKLSATISIDRPAKGFAFDGGSRATTVFRGVPTTSVLFLREANGCDFLNFTIDGGLTAGTGTGHGISAQNCINTVFRGIDVKNYADTAILVMDNPSFTGPSQYNRIVNCNAFGNGLANNGFMLESSIDSSIENCNVYALNPAGAPSYGLQIKNAGLRCSILGGSVDGAIAGVAFGNTTTEISRNCVVSGVRVSNVQYGLLAGYAEDIKVDMAIDLNSSAAAVQAVRIGSNCKYFTVNATVSNVPATATVCYMGSRDNNVRVSTLYNCAGKLWELFGAGAIANFFTLGKWIGYSTLTDPLLQIVDTSGATSNYFRYEADQHEQEAMGTGASVIRFPGSTGRDSWLLLSHTAKTLSARIDGTDQMVLSATSMNPGVDVVQSLGSSGKRWLEVWTKDGVILNSPNGTKYRIKVSDAGALSTVAV